MATSDIGHLRTRLSWEDEGTLKNLTRFKEDLRGLKSEMATVTSRGKDYTNSLKGLRQQSDILSRTLKTQKDNVQELNKRYQQAREAKGEDAKQTRNLATQYNKAVAEMQKTEQQLGRITTQLENQSNPWKRLARDAEAAGTKMQSVGQGMASFGRSYTMNVTAPITAGGIAVFKAASDFESAFAGVEKTFSGTSDQLEDLRTSIRDMAKEIPASTTEIAAVAEAAGQLGIKAESIEGFTRTMIDLGEATNLTSDQAATEFARFANIVGMSQEDFDKLGSSVVSLGNSMATTEAEISSMAMRLAAQGSQVGMTEAQIMALAASMSSLGIESEAGGSAMTAVLQKIQSAVDAGGKDLEAFAKAAGVSSSEFKKAWEKDAVAGLDALIKGLADSGAEGENLTSILDTLGIKGIREADTMLRMAGASDLLSTAVETSSKAWEENSALTEEAAQRYKTSESQMKIMWNRIKDIAITTGDALVPAIMDAIDASEPLIKSIEDGAKAFADMDEEQQRTILKMAGLVAAVGPAAVGVGNLTSGIGGLLKVGGSLAGVLGKAGGAGLIGRIGLLGPALTSPVGLAVAGVGALSLGIYAVAKASEESTEEVRKSLEARKEELDSMDLLIEQYGALQRKNKLSTDEVLRYMDIIGELKNAKGEDAIKALSDEQQKLLEKSGLTNDEMAEFLGLNEKIVEKAPSTAKAISEQGSAYAGVLEELQKLNAAEREKLEGDYYEAIRSETQEQVKNLEKQRDLQNEINGLQSQRAEATQGILDSQGLIQAKDLEIAELRDRINNATGKEKAELSGMLPILEDQRNQLEGAKKAHEGTVESLDKQISKKQDSLKETNKELTAFDGLLDDYAQMILFEQGIVAEKGKAVQAIKDQQRGIDTARGKLKNLWETGKITRAEYENQNAELDEQQRKIDVAKGKLEVMNQVAGKTVYKDLKVSTNPTIRSINEQLAAGTRHSTEIFVMGGESI
jgi:TP901 family phage tail tape measure protein